MRNIPKRYYKHISSARLAAPKAENKKSFWRFYVYFVCFAEEEGGWGDLKTQQVFSLMAHLSSFGKFSASFASICLQITYKWSGKSTQWKFSTAEAAKPAKPKSRIPDEHFGAFSDNHARCSVSREGNCKKLGMLNHRLADTINIPVVTCDVVHSVRQFRLPRK